MWYYVWKCDYLFLPVICLPGQPIGCNATVSESCGRSGNLMTTYEELQVILTFGLLIVAILNLYNKK